MCFCPSENARALFTIAAERRTEPKHFEEEKKGSLSSLTDYLFTYIQITYTAHARSYDEEEDGGDSENKKRWNAMWQRHDKLSTK